MSNDPVVFQLLPSLLVWAAITGVAAIFGLILTTIVAVGMLGLKGFGAVFTGVIEAVQDLIGTSPRRVWAIAVLTAKEAVRRKILLVFVVFGVFFLFAGWFLPKPGSDTNQLVETYVSFVLTVTSWLCLPIVFLMACWGLPADIKARSLHTVVTKPVRRNEILFGRILGVAGIGTLVLLTMGTVGYAWLMRAFGDENARKFLIARVPVYSRPDKGTWDKPDRGFKFFDREGIAADAGINTGDIWMFRSYIEGNTKARAIWEFEGVTPQQLGDSLRLESRIQVFRSHKGDMETGVLCQYTFVNEAKEIRAPFPAFPINEFRENVHIVGRELTDDQNKPVDLFKDLAPDGKLRLEVACLSGGQYLGMARPDLFIRKADAPFAASFFKALFGVWLIMFLVTVMGVVASSFLKGPVATCLVFFMLVMGRPARQIVESYVSPNIVGGGVLETIYRMLLHLNPDAQLANTVYVRIIQAIDLPFRVMAFGAKFIIPNIETCNLTEYTAKGYDIPWNTGLAHGVATVIGFMIPCLVLGYFSFKYRELESK